MQSNSDVPAKCDDSDILDLSKISDVEIETNILNVSDWSDYFNADMFEPYSPNNPLLTNFDLHDGFVAASDQDHQNNETDVLCNNISVVNGNDFGSNTCEYGSTVIAQAESSLVHLGNKTGIYDSQSTFDSFDSANLQIPGLYQGDVQYKSCAIQQLAANNMNATSMMHTQDIARNDMPLGLYFDDATMQMLSEYFGITTCPSPTTFLKDALSLRSCRTTGIESDDENQASASFDQACRMPVPVLDNKDLNNTGHMTTMNDSSDEDDTDEDEDILDADNIVRHFWMRGTNDIRFQIRHRSRNLYMTAQQLSDRFGNVNIAIWTYWKEKSKKRGQIPYTKVRAYLESFGVEGFYSELLWQFLTGDEHR